MEKYGFVYIWYDKKHKRFYIGCRWGREDDGYICSSSWMKQGYKNRPGDFRRRILSRIHTNRKDLLEEEHKWLSMIPDDELGKRYYNLRKHKWGHWSTDENQRLLISEKIKNDHPKPMLGKKFSEETRHKMSLAHLGKPKTKEQVIKSSQTRTGTKRSLESRMRMSEAQKGTKKPWAGGQIGRKDTDQAKENKRRAALIREQNKRQIVF